MLLRGLEEEDGGRERHPQCPTAEDGGGPIRCGVGELLEDSFLSSLGLKVLNSALQGGQRGQ